MQLISCRKVTLAAMAGFLFGPAVQAADVPGADERATHAVIPGFERFYAKAQGDAMKGGQLLLAELNCISCHHPEPANEAQWSSRKAPLLDGVGGRVRRSYLRKFLADPQAVKPGSTMPRLFAGLSERERQEKVEALVHFLGSLGAPAVERPDRKFITYGRETYHKIGCVACHGTRDAAGNPLNLQPTSVPLGDLRAKYVLGSLRKFLENPHATRPSGRMPSLLNGPEAKAVANYLLQDSSLAAAATSGNTKYTYYEGEWEKLPDFARLTPLAMGRANGFDLTVAPRSNRMALRFEGYLRIERTGQYHFHLTSDDGSKLYLDDKLVVSNDGVHASTTQTGKARLPSGMHKVVVEVFNADGPVELQVEIEGKGLGRQELAPLVFLGPTGTPVKVAPPVDPANDDDFPIRQELAAKGQALFASAGCANCHDLTEGKKAIASTLTATPLAKLKAEGGCLAAAPTNGLPRYELSAAQRAALAAALKAGTPANPLPPAEVIARTLTTFNCYACHQRDKIGGVEEGVSSSFTTTQQEMGEEGRVPPPLDGVGTKLTPAYFQRLLDKGAHDRPYMHTRMPGFGAANVGHLVAAFSAVDKLEPVPPVKFAVAPNKVKTDARHLVGGMALGCVKCHTFGGIKAEGVQGIDMRLMPQRLQREWFHRYVADPQKFRSGTRMPAAWVNGQSPLPAILDGTATQQIEAIWVYLSDGSSRPPAGIGPHSNILTPEKDTIIYRQFIEGAGTRAIGVGYPEKLNLAFDANNLRLAMIWQGGFLDAGRHWNDRGAGFVPPLGDNLVNMAAGPAFAVLAKDNEPWPTKSARELPGYQFLGYRLASDDRPTFLYRIHGVKVEDFPNAVAGKRGPIFRRTIDLTGVSVANLWFRAVAAGKIETLGDGRFRIDGEWILRIDAGAAPRLRQINGRTELLVPVRFSDNRAGIVEEFEW
jgi:mono/diheme cytochrome c family protein